MLSMRNSSILITCSDLFDERIVYSPDKDSVCSKRGTTEIMWSCLLDSENSESNRQLISQKPKEHWHVEQQL
jgi:hypothetical protein